MSTIFKGIGDFVASSGRAFQQTVEADSQRARAVQGVPAKAQPAHPASTDTYTEKSVAASSSTGKSSGTSWWSWLKFWGGSKKVAGGRDSSLHHDGWIPLSDAVAFFETVMDNQLEDIRARYNEIVVSGISQELLDEILLNRYQVAPAQLEHDIGHQNPNPNRSLTEVIMNALQAMTRKEAKAKVKVEVEDGRYTVEDSGHGMGVYEVFEELLIPQISGWRDRGSLGRFGEGFYTALAHLIDKYSIVIVETKKEGEEAIRIEFSRLNGELGIRWRRSNKREVGTTIEVRDSRITRDEMLAELKSSMSYVLGRNIIVNGEAINMLDPKKVVSEGRGSLYASDAKSNVSKVVITVGNVKIEEYIARGHNLPELIVLNFPLDTKLPEGRNQIRVDETVIEQLKAFLSHVSNIKEDKDKIAYLNAVAPVIEALQKRNEVKDSQSDLVERARSLMRKYVSGKKVMPADPLYDVVSEKDVVRVNRLYLDGSWTKGFQEAKEWTGEVKLLLTDFAGTAKRGITYDAERKIILLSRSLYESHRTDPAGLEVLTNLLPKDIRGSWNWSQKVGASRTEQVARAKPTGAANVEKASTDEPPVDPQVARVMKRHPVLRLQQSELEKLAAENPGALNLIDKLKGVMVRNIGLENLSIDKYFGSDTFIDSDFRIIRSDGSQFTDSSLDPDIIRHYSGPRDTLFAVKMADGSHKIYRSSDGSLLLEGRISNVTIIDELILVRDSDNLWQVYDLDGNLVTDEKYINADIAYARLVLTNMEGKIFYFSRKLEEDFGGFKAVRGRDGFLLIINKDGLPITDEKFELLYKFDKAGQFILARSKDGLYRILKSDGTPANAERYKGIRDKYEDFVEAQGEDGLWTVIHFDGSPAINGRYREIRIEGAKGKYFKVMDDDGLWRLVRRDGTPVIDHRFQEALEVQVIGSEDQFIRVQGEDGLWHLLNIDGTPVIDGSFSEVSVEGDRDQFIAVKREFSYFRLLNRDGSPAVDGEFRSIQTIGKLVILSELSDNFHILKPDGTIISAIKLSIYFGDRKLIVFQTNKNVRGVINDEGVVLIEGNFKNIDLVLRTRPLIIVQDQDLRYRTFKDDGTPLIEGRHRFVGGAGNRGFLQVRGLDEVYRVFSEEGKLLAENERMIFLASSGNDRAFTVSTSKFEKHGIYYPDGIRIIEGDYRRYEIIGDVLYADGLSALPISKLKDPDVLRNIEKIVALDRQTQSLALAFIALPPQQFDFALKLMAHTKKDMRYGKGLLAFMEKLHVELNLTLDVTGALIDIGLSLGFKDTMPPGAENKLRIIAKRLFREDLMALRDELTKHNDLHLAFAKKDWARFTMLSPKIRGYALYLAMDETELLLSGRSEIDEIKDKASFSLRDLFTSFRSHRELWKDFNGTAREASRIIKGHVKGAGAVVSARRIEHDMYNLRDETSMLFIRELLQNSFNAVRGEGTKGQVDIESYEEAGSHVLRIKDSAGMTLNEVINYLLIPGKYKTGDGDRFGVGFFTIYPGAKEIRIKTGIGDGKVSYFVLRPVYEGARVKDVSISYEVRNGSFKGTVIERVSNGDIAEFEAAMARNNVLTFGRFVDGRLVSIRYNGKIINVSMQPIAQKDVNGLGTVTIYEASENAYTVGLYVKDIPKHYFEKIPAAVRNLIIPKGVVIDLGKASLVRSKNDFVNPAEVEGKLMAAVNAMLLENYLGRFARGEINISGLPEEYFNKLYNFAKEDVIPKEIYEDAAAFRRGEGIRHIERYLDDRSFLQLLTLLPCLTVGSEKVSMYELLKRYERGDKIDKSKLPGAISNLINKAEGEKGAQQRNKADMDAVASQVGATSHGRDLTHGDWRQDDTHRHWDRASAYVVEASSYDAFLAIVDHVMISAGSQNHVLGLSSFVERNALADHRVKDGKINIYYLIDTVEKYAREISKILAAETYPKEQMHRLMVKIIYDVTHEMTHELLEIPHEWTHDPEFYRRQQQIVTTLLNSRPLNLESLWVELMDRYPNAGFMTWQEYLKLLVSGGNGAGRSGAGSMPSAIPTGEGSSPAPVSSAKSQDSDMEFEVIGDPKPTASSSKGAHSPSRTHAASGQLYMQNMMRINLLRPATTMPTVTPAARIVK